MSIIDISHLGGASDPFFRVYLEVAGVDGVQRISLVKGNIWRIGRTSQNDIVFPEDSVSRQHAIVQRTEYSQYYLIDIGSSNGSFVNGARIGIPKSLVDGDQIQIGDRSMIFRGCGAEPAGKYRETTQDLLPTRALLIPRRITVMVVDVRDFTKLTQLVDQSVLCKAIGTWFRKGGSIMQKRGSWSLKYIGDAIMAIWLHQRPGHEQEEIMGVLAAYVELAGASANFASEFSLPFEFRIGAGVNTGIATIGNTGGSGQMDFTAMGDTVNAAFRIESATKQVGVDIAIGAGTCKSLGQDLQLERHFQPYQVHLKGYDSPADIWGAKLEMAQGFVACQGTILVP